MITLFLSYLGQPQKQYIQEKHEHPPENDNWAGMALSGGGIRSATFCLGVLQQFAAKNLLSKFHYLSSVSGGGYISGSLYWWWCNENGKFGANSDNFPYGTPEQQLGTNLDGERNLRYLASNGNYIISGGRHFSWSAFAMLIRVILTSLLFWLPVITMIFIIMRREIILFTELPKVEINDLALEGTAFSAVGPIAIPFFLVLLLLTYALEIVPRFTKVKGSGQFWFLMFILMLFALGIVWISNDISVTPKAETYTALGFSIHSSGLNPPTSVGQLQRDVT